MFKQQNLNCIKKTPTTINTKSICTRVSVEIKQELIEREMKKILEHFWNVGTEWSQKAGGMVTFLMDD